MGLQLLGKPFDEATLLRAALAIEDAAGRFPVTDRWWEAGGENAPASKAAKKAGPKKKSGGKER